jgi:hypothetical protein
MKELDINDVVIYIERNIGSFHNSRLQRLSGLKLKDLLKRKNPYLFKAKNILLSQDLVKILLDAHLSSQEETIFGAFLEGLAIHICREVYGGRKSSTAGIDLEFDKEGIRYIVSVKSGPNWGNDSQTKKLKDYFKTAQKTLRTNNPIINIRAICGCCYGKNKKSDKGEYLKLCGQDFWELVSGNKNLYLEIIEPLGYKAREKNEEFTSSYSDIINKFTQEFANDFCIDGRIDWNRLVKYNSGRE